MSLLSLLIVLIVVGMLLYAVNHWLPIDPKFQTLINVVVILFAIIWLIRTFVPGIAGIRI